MVTINTLRGHPFKKTNANIYKPIESKCGYLGNIPCECTCTFSLYCDMPPACFKRGLMFLGNTFIIDPPPYQKEYELSPKQWICH